MGYRVRAGAAFARAQSSFDEITGRPSIDPWTAEPAGTGSPFPEIDCVRPLLAADVVTAAERRASAIGVGADRVLIASGALSEETYLRALGETLGVVFEPLDGIARAQCPIDDRRLTVAAIPVPNVGPRTKPKALNVELPFARGTFAVIYDAEDRPEPEQLRRALQAFRAGGDDLACVQARLCIDNTADGWLTRLYTAEYAGQFDVFLPGLAALRLPLPLGGSSNHFYGIR